MKWIFEFDWYLHHNFCVIETSIDHILTFWVGIWIPIFSIALANSSGSTEPLSLRSKYLNAFMRTCCSDWAPFVFSLNLFFNSLSKLQVNKRMIIMFPQNFDNQYTYGWDTYLLFRFSMLLCMWFKMFKYVKVSVFSLKKVLRNIYLLNLKKIHLRFLITNITTRFRYSQLDLFLFHF